MTSSNAVDFFALLGRKPGPFVCKNLMSIGEDESTGKKTHCHPSQIWGDAITDIAYVHTGNLNTKVPMGRVICLFGYRDCKCACCFPNINKMPCLYCQYILFQFLIDETTPEGENWELQTSSAEGKELRAPQLAIRRRVHSGRIDHITQVSQFLAILSRRLF